ncbi:DUF6484 domain-containing protein [Archangium violaceum]|uniref:DUF6484 domain-containing protein n=1 Tax=Archangium violaceum Cb vi76 TaxID=1406225 RepID=A0A084SJ60_9BACT|nr:DUF6484 domain-containing protein [Archangium violaceum]KFA88495.1 hypothetical protein Q664_40745 [Archangium violaceum Cb vi76]
MSSPDDCSTPEKVARSESQQPILGARVGRLVGLSLEGLPLVQFEGCPRPIPARSFVALDPAQLRVAAGEQRQAVLLFEEGDPARPMLVAMAQGSDSPSLLDQLLDEAARPGDFETPAPVEPAPARVARARNSVPEERLVLGAQRELVLQVGEASITLRRDGTILLRGVRVESRASGLQLIRGGKIELN